MGGSGILVFIWWIDGPIHNFQPTEHVLGTMPRAGMRLHISRVRSLAGEGDMSGGRAVSRAVSRTTGGLSSQHVPDSDSGWRIREEF